MSDLTGWHASYEDEPEFQNDVLAWLERIGVERPAIDQEITRVWLERDGEGAVVVMEKYVLPYRRTFDGIAMETMQLPLSSLPPARP